MDYLNPDKQQAFVHYHGRTFYLYEKILPDEVLQCHPQGVPNEMLGIPLRVTAGMQAFFDQKTREYRGVTFYAPSENSPGGPPWDNLKYVLASADGILRVINGELTLISDIVIVYSNIIMAKTSGTVKKGQIIGYVGEIPGGYGFGVSVRAYRNGEIVRIENFIRNITFVE